MAKICMSKRHCKDCKWYQIDDEESDFYSEYRYYCAAEPDEYGYVRFEENNYVSK